MSMAHAPVGVLIRFHARQGEGDRLTDHLVEAAGLAGEEPGTTHWIVHRVPDEPDSVWVYEIYADAAAREAHESSAAYHAARDHTRSLLAGPPDVFPVSPIGGKGLRGAR